MRTVLLASLPFALLAGTAAAQDATPTPNTKPEPATPPAPTAPAAAPELTLNGTATLISDYRFRGISQTNRQAAVQGSLTLTHRSGFYASVWGSSVDGYVTAAGDFYRDPALRTGCCQARQEIDLILGYKTTVGGTTFDMGGLYYWYPKRKAPGDVTASNFLEPYLSVAHTLGLVTAKVTANWAFKQKAMRLDQRSGRNRQNLYLAGDLSASVPNTPFGLTAHLAHSFGPSWLATDATGRKGYTDWSLGATATWRALTFGVQYVDTDARFLSYDGRNVSKGGIVGSVGVSF